MLMDLLAGQLGMALLAWPPKAQRTACTRFRSAQGSFWPTFIFTPWKPPLIIRDISVINSWSIAECQPASWAHSEKQIDKRARGG
jgi:hypothetical protein